MSTILNTPRCSSDGGATGVPTCQVDPKAIVGVILIDPSKSYRSTQFEELKGVLQADTVETGKTRIHPIFRFVEMADSSEDVSIQTLGYGAKIPIKEGKFDWTFRFLKGGLCLLSNLRQFNGLNKKAIFVDEDNNLWGVINADGDFTGFTLDFVYAYPFKATDGSKANEYRIRLVQSKPEEWDSYGVFQASWDVEETLKGIVNLHLDEVAIETGQVTIRVETACDKVNLYDDYKTELADTNLWTVTKVSDGSDVSVTSVIADDDYSAFVVSFTGTGDHTITLVNSKVLYAADIGGPPSNGFDTDTLTVTVPTS